MIGPTNRVSLNSDLFYFLAMVQKSDGDAIVFTNQDVFVFSVPVFSNRRRHSSLNQCGVRATTCRRAGKETVRNRGLKNSFLTRDARAGA
jgi:hypothetical protein